MTVRKSGRPILRSKYRVLGLIGQGQFGRVYCAAHRKTGRLVALKALDHHRFPTHQFLRELRFLLSLRHPNIVACQALEHTAKGRYLVMDYCEGGTLRHLLESSSRLTVHSACQLIRGILAGLGHAQLHGIIHCDIKPENILLTLSRDGWMPRVSDFGIARLSQDLKVGTGTTGSPAYMAPERFYGQYHPTTDLYAVGVMLYELLLGERPFSGTPMELMNAHLNRVPAIPNQVPPALQPILRQSLQKLPARRFQSAQEMLFALETALQGLDAKTLDLDQRLIFRNPPPSVPFQPVWSLALLTPVTQLALVSPEVDSTLLLQKGSIALPATQELLYHSSKTQVRCALYAGNVLTDRDPLVFQREFEREVCNLVTTPRGCFVVTRQQIYHWTWQASQGTSLQFCVPAPIACIQDFPAPVQVAIAAQGNWFAAASHPLGLSEVQIQVGKLCLKKPIAASDPCLPSPALLRCRAPSLSQLLILDTCHGIALGQHPNHSCLELFNRRGQALGSLSLGVMIERCGLGQRPYQLVGLEVGQRNSLLVMDLKPLRIQRFLLPIVPHHCLGMGWGYLVANFQGDIILLDRQGEIVGQIQSPLASSRSASTDSRITALTALGDHGVLLATWDGKQGYLFAIDLRQLEIDLLF